MALKDSILPEYDHEMGTTRRLLERVPEADFAWTPHDKSFSMGRLAGHIAAIPRWVPVTLDNTAFDVTTATEEERGKAPASVAALLKTFDENVKAARAKIDEQTDPALFATWTLKQGTQEVFIMPKIAVLRSFIMNHMIHH